jgi:hypothetical protein
MSFFSKKKKNKPIQKSWERTASQRRVGAASIEKRDGVKRKKKFSRFLFWFLLLFFLGICGYLLIFSPFLAIGEIVIEGNEEISSVEILSATEKYLDGKILWYLPQNNFFLVNKGQIGVAIKDAFERLEVENIEKKFPDKLLIKVTERKAELVWCSGGVCYFVEKSGLAYGGAIESEDELRAGNFLVVVDDSSIPVEIGRTKIDSDYIKFIEEAGAMIRNDLKLDPVESYHTPGVASKEMGVRTSEGWILKIGKDTSVDETKKIIRTLFEKNLDEETRKNLDYLDLRVKGKIYYKLKV